MTGTYITQGLHTHCTVSHNVYVPASFVQAICYTVTGSGLILNQMFRQLPILQHITVYMPHNKYSPVWMCSKETDSMLRQLSTMLVCVGYIIVTTFSITQCLLTAACEASFTGHSAYIYTEDQKRRATFSSNAVFTRRVVSALVSVTTVSLKVVHFMLHLGCRSYTRKPLHPRQLKNGVLVSRLPQGHNFDLVISPLHPLLSNREMSFGLCRIKNKFPSPLYLRPTKNHRSVSRFFWSSAQRCRVQLRWNDCALFISQSSGIKNWEQFRSVCTLFLFLLFSFLSSFRDVERPYSHEHGVG